uniref:Vitelline envelope zona pellucida domain protein 14 n=1 Tax=Haliotis fulgens TaxID=6456 RepID=D0EL74_HALFU|nr:vitelline envelope zona pellucida domain protein 14 [Haliotis fulgens]
MGASCRGLRLSCLVLVDIALIVQVLTITTPLPGGITTSSNGSISVVTTAPPGGNVTSSNGNIPGIISGIGADVSNIFGVSIGSGANIYRNIFGDILADKRQTKHNQTIICGTAGAVVHNQKSEFGGCSVTYSQMICANSTVPMMLPDESSFYVLRIYLPSSQKAINDINPCVMDGPYKVIGTSSLKYNVTVSMLWNDGRATGAKVHCLVNGTTTTPTTTTTTPTTTTTTPTTTPTTTTTTPTTTTTTTTTTPTTTTTTTTTTPTTTTTTTTPTTTTTTTTTTPTTTTTTPSNATTSYCDADKNPDYIVHIETKCGSTSEATPSIVIRTDLHLSAIAVCYKDQVYNFSTSDTVHFRLNASYNQTDYKDRCVFSKRTDTEVYNLRIEVSWGERFSHVHTCKKEYQITCTFEGRLSKGSASSKSGPSLIAAQEIQSHQGQKGSSSISLDVVNVLGKPIPGPIPLARRVQLLATASGTSSELGLRPVACDAVSADGHRYAVLRAGCGDGIIFAKNQGFTTRGLLTFSPFFKTFKIRKDNSLKFECNFTLCASNCDGDSCSGRIKRSAESFLEEEPSPIIDVQSSNTREWLVLQLVLQLACIAFFVMVMSQIVILVLLFSNRRQKRVTISRQ